MFKRFRDPELHKRVAQICDLATDFELFPKRPNREVGETGVTLSGGQKARLALARRLYYDQKLIVLDDVLSAMDAHVSQHVFKELIKLSREQQNTTSYSTHNVGFFSGADTLITIDDKKSVMQIGQEAIDSLLIMKPYRKGN